MNNDKIKFKIFNINKRYLNKKIFKMAEVEFSYEGSSRTIPCNIKDKFKDIIKKFFEKEGITLGNKFYLYNGGLINSEELTFEQIANTFDLSRKKMAITIVDDIFKEKKKDFKKPIICPECHESIRMDIKDYKINLFKCKNGHNIENILFNEFEDTQRINFTVNTKETKYDDENYYYKCNESGHNEAYSYYCEDCEKNLCTQCDGHKDHKIILFMHILPKKDDLMQKKEELKSTVNLFNSQIRALISILNDVKKKINIYYKIYEDMINNYNNKKRNYEIIYNLIQLQNNKIQDELNKIIESNIIDKYKSIFNIYQKINMDEINIIYDVKNLKEVKLFCGGFIERYKNYVKIVIEGKEQDLIEEYKLSNYNKNILQVKLKGITNIIDMSSMFVHCKSLLSLPDIHRWNTTNVINMSWMFECCNSLKSLPDISRWDTSNVTNMSWMFYECSSLSTLPDISKWDTSNITEMYEMFFGCSSLKSLPDIYKISLDEKIN